MAGCAREGLSLDRVIVKRQSGARQANLWPTPGPNALESAHLAMRVCAPSAGANPHGARGSGPSSRLVTAAGVARQAGELRNQGEDPTLSGRKASTPGLTLASFPKTPSQRRTGERMGCQARLSSLSHSYSRGRPGSTSARTFGSILPQGSSVSSPATPRAVLRAVTWFDSTCRNPVLAPLRPARTPPRM